MGKWPLAGKWPKTTAILSVGGLRPLSRGRGGVAGRIGGGRGVELSKGEDSEGGRSQDWVLHGGLARGEGWPTARLGKRAGKRAGREETGKSWQKKKIKESEEDLSAKETGMRWVMRDTGKGEKDGRERNVRKRGNSQEGREDNMEKKEKEKEVEKEEKGRTESENMEDFESGLASQNRSISTDKRQMRFQVSVSMQ